MRPTQSELGVQVKVVDLRTPDQYFAVNSDRAIRKIKCSVLLLWPPDRSNTMYDGYYGKITSDVYAAALRLRGDEQTCWEERVPLAEPPLVFGSQFPEDWFGDEVIAIWEAALAEARQEFGEGRYTLESVTLYLKDNQNSFPSGEIVWRPTVKANLARMT